MYYIAEQLHPAVVRNTQHAVTDLKILPLCQHAVAGLTSRRCTQDRAVYVKPDARYKVAEHITYLHVKQPFLDFGADFRLPCFSMIADSRDPCPGKSKEERYMNQLAQWRNKRLAEAGIDKEEM